MAERLSEKAIAQLFETVLQHAKCIEIRVDYARALTTQKQKHALTQALNKINSAINSICDLLPNSDAVLTIKKELDKVDLVWVMVLTEQLSRIPASNMEEVVDIIDKYLIEKFDLSDKPAEDKPQATN
jgi:hypothetical protein